MNAQEHRDAAAKARNNAAVARSHGWDQEAERQDQKARNHEVSAAAMDMPKSKAAVRRHNQRAMVARMMDRPEMDCEVSD